MIDRPSRAEAETGPRQDGEIVGQGAAPDPYDLAQLARRQAVRPGANERAEYRQSPLMGESGQSIDG